MAQQLKDLSFDSGFLRLEMEIGGRAEMLNKLRAALIAEFGETWATNSTADLVEYISGLPEWVESMDLAADLGLLIMTVQGMQQQWSLQQTSQHNAGEDKLVRKRLRYKQPRPQCYEFAVLPEPPPPPEAPHRVRVPKQKKLMANRFRLHAEGDFTCHMRKRVFPNKAGLSRHVELAHTEGTFREEGFPCDLCPRIFDRLSARTRHYSRDHVRDSTALMCPYCKAVFPGDALTRLHLAEQHQTRDEDFPQPCFLCAQRGDPNPP